jgi:hypothetical protein
MLENYPSRMTGKFKVVKTHIRKYYPIKLKIPQQHTMAVIIRTHQLQIVILKMTTNQPTFVYYTDTFNKSKHGQLKNLHATDFITIHPPVCLPVYVSLFIYLLIYSAVMD